MTTPYTKAIIDRENVMKVIEATGLLIDNLRPDDTLYEAGQTIMIACGERLEMLNGIIASFHRTSPELLANYVPLPFSANIKG